MTTDDKKSSLDQFFASLAPEAKSDEDLQTDTENRGLVPEGERPCPICGKHMTADKKQGIQVDVCHDHGVWLDRGELSAVIGKTKDQAVKDAMAKAGDSGEDGGFLLGYALGQSL